MPGFVRSDADEKKWSKAKKIAKEKGLSDDKMYAYANAVFHRMKGKKEESQVNESLFELSEDKLKLYSQLDYSVNSLNEDEMWHLMKHILSEHPNFNVDLAEEDQYVVLEYLFDNYKNTINENDYNKIKDYLNEMVIPKATHKHRDRSIDYGVLEEDYISGGFGGMGSAEYGYGGVGYAGGRARRRGFGGPRQGGQMSRRATGNPFKIGGDSEEPIAVDIPNKKSTYKPWEVELTPDGQPVNRIKRSHNEHKIDSAWDSQIGASLMGLEAMGVDLEELGNKSPEEIEDILLRKFKQIGTEAEQENLQENIFEEDNIHKKITTIFEDDYDQELEEKIQRNTRIQDARDILAKKHQLHKAYERNRDKSYVINQYGIERLMKKYGYVYDDKTMKWIKKAKQPSDDKAIKGFGSSDDSEIVSDTSDEESEDIQPTQTPPETENVDDEPSKENVDDEPSEDDYEQFENAKDPVRLESKLKPLQARFILDLTLESQDATKFNMTKDGSFIPKIPDDEIVDKMYTMKLDWDGDKDIWVDDTNTIPQQVFSSGEDRQSLLSRSYLAAMGELAAIQFNNRHQPLFNNDETTRRMEQNNYVWNTEINKWTYNDKDLANTPAQDENLKNLTESVLYEAEDSQIVDGNPAIDENDLEELQARYLYRLVQLNALKTAPQNQKVDIESIVLSADQNPTLIEGGSKISGNRIIKLLSGRVTPTNKPPEPEPKTPQVPNMEDEEENNTKPQTVKESILKIFEQDEENVDDVESVELGGEKAEEPEEDVIELGGEDEIPQPKEEKEKEPQPILISDANEIIPSVKYEWDDKLNIWTENGKIPELITDVEDNQLSFAGRAVLTNTTDKPDFIEIEKNGEPVVDAKRVLRILNKNENINWDTKRNLWVAGKPIDQNALNPLEENLKAYDEQILQRYNNGQGYDKSGMSVKQFNDLRNALIAKEIIGSGKYSEKEWYRMPENDEKKQAEAEKRRNKERSIFKLKNIIQEKQYPTYERPSPRQTHYIEIRPRLQLASRLKKALTDSMLNIGKRLFTGSLSTLGKAVMTGMIIAAASQGYQGPYKFTPFERGMSTAYKQYWGKKYQDYYTQMYASRRQPMGLTPKSSGRGTRGGGARA